MTKLLEVYKTVSSISVFISICILITACQQKERAPIELSELSASSISPLRSESFHDAPLVYHHDYGTTIHHMKRAPDYSLLAHTDTSHSHTPTISVYANSQFEFEVDIKHGHSPTAGALSKVDTVFVTSDIEGNYRAFVSLLEGNRVIDSAKNWIYNDNHLVLIGDMVDRGDQVLQVLWLIYKLEAEAVSHGGAVHYLLGNHEVMNLRSSYRAQNTAYVHSTYKQYARTLDIPYHEWWDNKTELGRWLRSKNTVLSIDGVLFAHGGLSNRAAGLGLSLEDMNERIRTSMSTESEDMDKVAALLHSSEGPFWYREIADQKISQKKIQKIIHTMKADRMVIGHTIVEGHHITPIYEDKIIPIDMHHSETFKKGVVRALLIDGTGFYEVDNKRQSQLLFTHHPIEI